MTSNMPDDMNSAIRDVELHGELPSLDSPILIVMLQGWIDAADAARSGGGGVSHPILEARRCGSHPGLTAVQDGNLNRSSPHSLSAAVTTCASATPRASHVPHQHSLTSSPLTVRHGIRLLEFHNCHAAHGISFQCLRPSLHPHAHHFSHAPPHAPRRARP